MASGSFLFDIYSGSAESGSSFWQVRCSWSSTPNATNNTSYVTASIQAREIAGQNPTSNRYTCHYEFWNNSTESSIVGYTTATVTKTVTSSWTTLKTISFTAYHDSNGNCEVYPVMDVSCDDGVFDHDLWMTNRDVRMNLGSTRQKATITSAPNFKDTDNPTVSYSNPLGSSVSALEMSIYDTSGYTPYAAYRSISKTGSSYTFNLTDAERAALIAAAGSSTTLEVRFYLRTTISGSTYLSYSTKTFTVEAGAPTITASISDVKAATKALTGGGTKFIRGNNSMQYSMTATGQKGATITKYSVICGNMTSSSASGTFTNIENDVVIFSATDSRGKTATKTVQLSAIDYVKLTCNQTATMIMESESSAQVHLEITGNFFNGSFGAKSNTLKLYVRHARNGEALGDWVDLSALLYETDGNTYSLSPDVSGLDPSGSYIFQCKAVDALSEATSGQYTVKFMPVFDWSKYDFNFNVPISIEGNPLEDYVIDTGTEAMGTNGTWYWSKWKSGKAECYGCRNYGNMAVTTAWGGLYRSESFSQSLPYGLFIDTPEVIDVTYRVSNYGGWIAQHEGTAPSSSNSGGFIVVRPASATLNQAHIGFHVIGRWKE